MSTPSDWAMGEARSLRMIMERFFHGPQTSELMYASLESLERKIALALDAARKVPEGCVRLPDGSEAVCLVPSRGPRLHRTNDGALVPDHSCYVWAYERMGDGRFTGKIISMHYGTWFATRWDDCLPACWNDNAPDGEWGCYSTSEAAEAARKDGTR